MESRLPGDGHGRFGGRARETGRVKPRNRALVRPYGEALAGMLRRGGAGSGTAADHLRVLEEAITAIPLRHRRRLMVTCDGAGASHALITRLHELACRPGHQLIYSVGWDLSERERQAITAVPRQAWQIAVDVSAASSLGDKSARFLKPTVASVLGCDRAVAQAEALASQAASHLDLFDEKADLLRAAAAFVVSQA